MILTLARTQVQHLPQAGCWAIDNLDFMAAPLWQTRADVEQDERYLQPIVYLVLLNAAGQAWAYQRAGGDARLDGRCSCGVGGHVDQADHATGNAANSAVDNAPDATDDTASTDLTFDASTVLRRALLREVAEELQTPEPMATVADAVRDLRLRGLIYEGLSAVGRVHLGVLYTAQWLPTQAPQARAGEKLTGLGFVALDTIATDSRFELWSRLAAQHLLTA